MKTVEPDTSNKIFLAKLCRDLPAKESARWETFFRTVVSMPKAELHCHLAGSMRPHTLQHLARTVPALDWSFCDAGFGNRIARIIAEGKIEEVKRYLEYRKVDGSLSDYMLAYALPKTVMATEDALRRVAFEVCEDNHRDGVTYLEIRFNPRMLTERIKVRPYVEALAQGMDMAVKKYPRMEVALMLSIVKDYEEAVVERILDDVLEANQSPTVRSRIKGMDSAGNEMGFAFETHARVFARARDAGLGIVCHAGEAYSSLEDGITMIEDAIDVLGARRIGHGLAAGIDATPLLGSHDLRGRRYDAKRVRRITERQSRLRKRLRDEDVLIEVCPSSNVHTGNVRSLDDHPLRVFLADGVPVAICTDNRWVSHTKLSWEIVRMAERLNLPLSTVKRIIAAPFRYRLEDIRG
jgi:adenosine deaminase